MPTSITVADSKWLGLSAASCRVDRLIRGLKNTVHPVNQAYCGVGQSGGAVQLAYTVAHHGADTVWDSLVLTSGPTIVDEVFGCSENSPCDQTQSDDEGCFDEGPECLVDQAYGNPHPDCKAEDDDDDETTPPIIVGSVGPCEEDPLPTTPDWIAKAEMDSLVTVPLVDGDYDYPFAVHFIYGELDRGEAPPQGMKYRRTLLDVDTGGTTCQSLLGVKHGVPWGLDDDTTGPATVLKRVQDYCVLPHPAADPADEDLDCEFDHNEVP